MKLYQFAIVSLALLSPGKTAPIQIVADVARCLSFEVDHRALGNLAHFLLALQHHSCFQSLEVHDFRLWKLWSKLFESMSVLSTWLTVPVLLLCVLPAFLRVNALTFQNQNAIFLDLFVDIALLYKIFECRSLQNGVLVAAIGVVMFSKFLWLLKNADTRARKLISTEKGRKLLRSELLAKLLLLVSVEPIAKFLIEQNFINYAVLVAPGFHIAYSAYEGDTKQLLSPLIITPFIAKLLMIVGQEYGVMCVACLLAAFALVQRKLGADFFIPEKRRRSFVYAR